MYVKMKIKKNQLKTGNIFPGILKGENVGNWAKEDVIQRLHYTCP
jgi:hypothetical protein